MIYECMSTLYLMNTKNAKCASSLLNWYGLQNSPFVAEE